MRQPTLLSGLAPLPGFPGLAGLPDVTVTLAPDGGDTTVPLVGYLVLAPAETELAETLGPSATDPSPAERADPERADPAGQAGAGLVIDEARRTVTADGRNLSLTYLEFELLAHLVRHPHRVYTRDQLVTSIWGYGPVGDQRTVDVHVARLRRKLGPAYRGRIVTIRRVGYKYAPAA